MPQQAPTIPPEVAAHVLWQFGAEGGYGPGSFTQHLLNAFASADPENTARLEQAYPEYGAAVAAAQYDPNGIAHLQNIAGGAA